MKEFVVLKHWKDGNLAERLQAENLPAEFTGCDAKHRYFVYQASTGLLRSLVSAGCEFVILPSDETERNEFLYIYDMELK
jgi:hypothetical protein